MFYVRGYGDSVMFHVGYGGGVMFHDRYGGGVMYSVMGCDGGVILHVIGLGWCFMLSGMVVV